MIYIYVFIDEISVKYIYIYMYELLRKFEYPAKCFASCRSGVNFMLPDINVKPFRNG